MKRNYPRWVPISPPQHYRWNPGWAAQMAPRILRRLASRARNRPDAAAKNAVFKGAQKQLRKVIKQSKVRCWVELYRKVDMNPWRLGYKIVTRKLGLFGPPEHVVVKWWKKVLNSCYTRILKEKNFFFFQPIVFSIYFHNPFPPGWPEWSFIYEKWFKVVKFLLILQDFFSFLTRKFWFKWMYTIYNTYINSENIPNIYPIHVHIHIWMHLDSKINIGIHLKVY